MNFVNPNSQIHFQEHLFDHSELPVAFVPLLLPPLCSFPILRLGTIFPNI